jgi:hypothetical protein
VSHSTARDSVIAAAELFAEGNFYRVAIPEDILEGIPNPANWPTPTATLEPAGCDPLKFFQDHTIIFGASRLISFRVIESADVEKDITFCGVYKGINTPTRRLTQLLIFQVTGLVTHTRHPIVLAHVPNILWIRPILWYDATRYLTLMLNYSL